MCFGGSEGPRPLWTRRSQDGGTAKRSGAEEPPRPTTHSFSLEPDNDDSNPIAKISNQAKENKGKLIYINENNEKNIANDKLEMFRLFAKHLKSNDVKLETGSFEVVPYINSKDKIDNECIIINGPKGEGKSTWAGEYAKKWQKLFPKSPIFLLSNKPLEEEPAFNKLKHLESIPLTKDALIEITGDIDTLKKKSKKK